MTAALSFDQRIAAINARLNASEESRSMGWTLQAGRFNHVFLCWRGRDVEVMDVTGWKAADVLRWAIDTAAFCECVRDVFRD